MMEDPFFLKGTGISDEGHFLERTRYTINTRHFLLWWETIFLDFCVNLGDFSEFNVGDHRVSGASFCGWRMA